MVVVVLTVAGLFIVYTDNRNRSVCRKSCIVIVGESGRSYTIVG